MGWGGVQSGRCGCNTTHAYKISRSSVSPLSQRGTIWAIEMPQIYINVYWEMVKKERMKRKRMRDNSVAVAGQDG